MMAMPMSMMKLMMGIVVLVLMMIIEVRGVDIRGDVMIRSIIDG